MGVLFGLLGGLIPLAILGGVVYAIVRIAQHGLQVGIGGFRGILRGYLRFAYFASLIVALIGIGFLLTAVFAALFGHDFSYSVINYPQRNFPPGSSVIYGTVTDNRQTDDLIRGISMLLTGLILGGAHRYGLQLVETPGERTDSLLARIESVVGTFGFGLVAIVAVPVAAYSLIRFIVLGTQGDTGGSNNDPPGGPLAVAITFLPIWAWYLNGMVRRARKEVPPPG